MTFTSFSVSKLAALVLPAAMLLGHAGAVQASTAPAKKASAAAPAPGLVERTKTATKKAAHATGEAISNAGKAIDKKVPRTEAYKKKHPNEVPGSGKN